MAGCLSRSGCAVSKGDVVIVLKAEERRGKRQHIPRYCQGDLPMRPAHHRKVPIASREEKLTFRVLLNLQRT